MLEDRELRLKLRESGAKTLDEAVSRELQNRGDVRGRIETWQRSIGQTYTRATTRGKERASRAYQAEHACYEPDGCGGSATTATAIDLEGSTRNKT